MTLLETTIRRSSQTRIVFGLIGLLLALTLTLVSFRYLYNLLLGPFELSTADLLAITEPERQLHYRVILSGDEAYETGYEYLENQGNRQVLVYTYTLLQLDEQFLVIQHPGGLPGTPTRRVAGELVTMPERVAQEVVQGIVTQSEALEGRFLSVMLQARNFNRTGYFGVVVLVAWFAVSGWLLYTGLRRWSLPSRHPAAVALAAHGLPFTIATELERQLHIAHPTAGTLHLLPEWVVNITPGKFQAARYADLIWIYMRVTQQKGSAGSGKTLLVCACDRHGTVLAALATELLAHQMLLALTDRAPHALTGDKADLRRQWRSERPAMIATVDARRAASP